MQGIAGLGLVNMLSARISGNRTILLLSRFSATKCVEIYILMAHSDGPVAMLLSKSIGQEVHFN